jgi:hypothetical protein
MFFYNSGKETAINHGDRPTIIAMMTKTFLNVVTGITRPKASLLAMNAMTGKSCW